MPITQPDMHLQFCQDGQDITGDPYAAQDATEVRAWTPDSTCLGAVTLQGETWHASASDITDWVSLSDTGYEGWQAALAALLATEGIYLPAQP